MPAGEMKGITVKIDADLHAEFKTYLETHEMTMGEFIALAAEDELHPKITERGEKSMENMRTLASKCRKICSSGSRSISSATA